MSKESPFWEVPDPKKRPYLPIDEVPKRGQIGPEELLLLREKLEKGGEDLLPEERERILELLGLDEEDKLEDESWEEFLNRMAEEESVEHANEGAEPVLKTEEVGKKNAADIDEKEKLTREAREKLDKTRKFLSFQHGKRGRKRRGELPDRESVRKPPEEVNPE